MLSFHYSREAMLLQISLSKTHCLNVYCVLVYKGLAHSEEWAWDYRLGS